jgi:hypothetical protein
MLVLHCVDATCERCRAARAGTPGVGDHTGSASGSGKPRPQTDAEKIPELTNVFAGQIMQKPHQEAAWNMIFQQL